MKNIFISIFIVHFTLVTISVFENVHLISPKYTLGIAQVYTKPFFEQNWGMFSNPPQTTKRVYFQFHTLSENGTYQDSKWYDVNQSIYDYNKSHLFSIAQRLIKYESGCLNNIFKKINQCKDPTPDVCIEFSAGFHALRNYARIIHENNLPVSTQIDNNTRFTIKIVESFFPDFDDRHLEYFDGEHYEYAVFTTKAYDLL